MRNLLTAVACGGGTWLIYGQAGYPHPAWISATAAGTLLLGMLSRPGRPDPADHRPAWMSDQDHAERLHQLTRALLALVSCWEARAACEDRHSSQLSDMHATPAQARRDCAESLRGALMPPDTRTRLGQAMLLADLRTLHGEGGTDE